MTSSSQSHALSGRTLDLSKPSHYLLVALIMGLMGAFLWAIRGTAGFGGWQGGLLAGLGWGLIWMYFSNRERNGDKRPLSNPWMVAAITFGMAYGGMTGYGAYIGWVSGNYWLNHPEAVRDIAPWTGYLTLFFCGLHWGGVSGAFMAWCHPGAKLDWKGWVLRLASGLAGAFAVYYLIKGFPQWFLPFYGEGIYENPENRTSIRALNSHLNIAPHLGFFFGFLAFEIARRDWKAVGIMVIMALGFAIFFSAGAYWHTMHGQTDLRLDWWKNWEMSIGLGGGLAMGLVFYLYNRPSSDTATYRFTPKSWIIGAGLSIWFASTIVFRNIYRGLTHQYIGHDLTFEQEYMILFSLIYLIPASILFFLFARKAHKPDKMLLQNIGFLAVLVLFSVALYQVRLLYLVPVTILAAAFFYYPKSAFDGMAEGAYPIPDRVVVALTGLIVAVGMILSIHLPMQLYNNFLVGIYVFFIVVSLILYFRIPAVGQSGR